ncbi:hypothetical protein, partial [Salinicola sp. DM10]|uniref:hypothetical protein n=1 Tax=Salinicola sp. DM10 TaxID=2815721 RepID=UPI001A8DA934
DDPVARPDTNEVTLKPGLVYFASGEGALETWNLATGSQTSVAIKDGSDSVVTGLGDIASSATSGTLYGVSLDTSMLYSIDAGTGTATELGQVSGLSQVNSLALMPDGNLIAASFVTPGLFSIDPTTLVATQIAETGFTAGGDLQYVGNHLYLSDSSGNVLEVALNNDGSIRTDAQGNATTTVVASLNGEIYGLAENG